MARSASARLASRRSARARLASRRFAPVRSAPVRSAPPRSASLRSAPLRLALLRSTLVSTAALRSAPLRSAPLRSRSFSDCPERLQPLKSASRRILPRRFSPLKSWPLRSLPATTHTPSLVRHGCSRLEALILPAVRAIVGPSQSQRGGPRVSNPLGCEAVDRVGIVATGQVGFTSISPGLSYKELVFEAAMRAYAGAGINPRRDVDSFVCASEDFLEGTSIFDEYVPDQLGAAQRPVQTVAADGLVAVATGVMLIRSGVSQVVACEAHSKASDIVTLPDILAFALDPVFERPLGVHPWFVAGLEMTSFLAGGTATIEDCWDVAATNRCCALGNPSAAYAEIMTPPD